MLNSQGSLNRLGATGRNPYGPSAASLNLDFTASNTLDSRITFTRATTATYFNSSGVLSTAASGEARFDYNPTTLAARGLLIEEQRTNSELYSEDFANAHWQKKPSDRYKQCNYCARWEFNRRQTNYKFWVRKRASVCNRGFDRINNFYIFLFCKSRRMVLV